MKHLIAAFVLTAAAHGGQPGPTSVLKPLEYFAGSWIGEEAASFGKGQGERQYRFILQGRYLISQNTSRFPPQGGRAEQVHEDWSVFSYDAARKAFVVRQFNSEGFVNILVMEPGSVVPRKMRFVGESSENAPKGTEVVLEYEVVNDGEFAERFEVRFPGQKPIEIRNRWRRVQR